jgi:uncharacterized protein YcaQ
VAPSADLVLWSRLGPSYDPDDLVAALEEDRTLFELGSYIRPMSDVGMHLAGAADWPHEGEYPGTRGHIWLEDNELEPNDVGEVGEPAEVDGVKGEWRVDPALLEGLDDFEGRTALLSPYDRLVHDRVRAQELFDFEYSLEMYKPAAMRRWGYYALPILYGDRLVGKVDATADRKAGMLFVDAIHQDVPFSPPIRSGVQGELDALASWLGVDLSLTR